MSELRYLVFELSDGSDGWQTLDAMASVPLRQWPAVCEEAQQVLGWLTREYGFLRGPQESGGGWDVELQASREQAQTHTVTWDADTGALHFTLQEDVSIRQTLSVSICAAPEVAVALQEAFGLEV